MFKNKLFKERLKDTGISAVAAVITLILIGVAVLIFAGAMAGLNYLWKPLDDIVFFGAIGIYILYHAVKGFKWLFIDPFKKQDKEELED